MGAVIFENFKIENDIARAINALEKVNQLTFSECSVNFKVLDLNNVKEINWIFDIPITVSEIKWGKVSKIKNLDLQPLNSLKVLNLSSIKSIKWVKLPPNLFELNIGNCKIDEVVCENKAIESAAKMWIDKINNRK